MSLGYGTHYISFLGGQKRILDTLELKYSNCRPLHEGTRNWKLVLCKKQQKPLAAESSLLTYKFELVNFVQYIRTGEVAGVLEKGC